METVTSLNIQLRMRIRVLIPVRALHSSVSSVSEGVQVNIRVVMRQPAPRGDPAFVVGYFYVPVIPPLAYQGWIDRPLGPGCSRRSVPVVRRVPQSAHQD